MSTYDYQDVVRKIEDFTSYLGQIQQELLDLEKVEGFIGKYADDIYEYLLIVNPLLEAGLHIIKTAKKGKFAKLKLLLGTFLKKG